jgi:hypothetical protein
MNKNLIAYCVYAQGMRWTGLAAQATRGTVDETAFLARLA